MKIPTWVLSTILGIVLSGTGAYVWNRAGAESMLVAKVAVLEALMNNLQQRVRAVERR